MFFLYDLKKIMSTANLRATTADDEDDQPNASRFGCPIDVSCLWTVPRWALATWLTSAAGLLGVSTDDNAVARRPRYVPLAHGDTGASTTSAAGDDTTTAAAAARHTARHRSSTGDAVITTKASC